LVDVEVLEEGFIAHTWDLEVETDHSFVAEGFVVHNSSGKSLSIRLRAVAFPFIHPGQEMVVTAPEGNHLDAITDNIEIAYMNNRLPAEMLVRGRNGIKHRPFHCVFANGSRIMGRIPQRDGRGIKGCDVGHTPILTNKGFVRADEIQPGDMVMTHEGRWRPVERVDVDVNDCYEVRGIGGWPLTVSCDHRFLGASDWSKSPGRTKRNFSGGLYFEDVERLVDDHFYWATPTEFPHLDVVYPEFDSSCKELEVETYQFWWLVGLYLADGHLTNENGMRWRVHWTSHAQDKTRQQLLDAVRDIGAFCSIKQREHSSADRVEMSSTPVAKWLCEYFGKLAAGKRLPPFVLSMKEEFRRALLDGYLAGDGCWTQSKNRRTVGTASEHLALGLQFLAQSLGLKCSGHHVVQPNVTQIKGVELKSKPLPSHRFHIYASGHGSSTEVDGYHLGKVKKVVPVGKQQVYNIIVEEDHSHLSGSIMSHNIHPIWLELDEGQDYPEAGWNEIIETLKRDKGASWRCIAEGQLVVTDSGSRPIESLAPGDLVLTHTGHWRPVVQVFENGERECVRVSDGAINLVATPDHEVFVDGRWVACEDLVVGVSNLSVVFGYGFAPSTVQMVEPAGKHRVYDLEVEGDHSYVVEGVVVHNCHGVTRGVRDKFYQYTQPHSGWKVHHYPAMYRPNWTEEERQEKIQLYGHQDSPDYKRNVLGLHGDASSPLFVLTRLMACADQDRSSEYNLDEYWSLLVDEAHVRDYGGTVMPMLLPPGIHKSRYSKFWIGADIGYTLAPTAIVVFAESKPNKSDATVLKLLGRIILRRLAHEHQVETFLWLLDYYRPEAFAMDSTGLGLPLYQDIQNRVRENPELQSLFDRVKGYNFSGKIPVEFDDKVEIDEFDPQGYEAALIKRNVLEWSSDVLRGLVDEQRLLLPWDQELLGEFKGEEYTYDKSRLDMYGRRKNFNAGSFHTLDACRMAVLAWKQAALEEMLNSRRNHFEPVETIFFE
jgi:hypothetical protein